MNPRTHSRRLAGLVASLVSGSFQPAAAATWTNFYDDWDQAFAWNPAMPDAVGAVADLSTINYTSENVVNLKGTRMVGSMMLGDKTAPVYATRFRDGTVASTLVFDNGGAGATLGTLVSSDAPPAGFNRPPEPANQFDVPVVLGDNLTLSVNTGAATATVTPWIGVIFQKPVTEAGGARSLTVGGNGRGITGFNAPASFSGGCTVNTGSLQAGVTGSLGSGPIVVQPTGQAAWYDDHVISNDLTIGGNGFAEPEGDRGALSFRQGVHNLTGSLAVASNARIEGTSGTVVHLEGPLTGTANLEINALNGGTDVTKRSGTFVLLGDASGFSGKIAVSRGRLDLGPASNPAGNVTVAQTGILGGETTIGGNLGFNTSAPPGSQSVLRVDPSTPEALHVSGNLTLSGATTVALTDVPAGTSTTVLSYDGSLSGGTANLDLEGGFGSYRAGTGFDVTTSPGEVVLNVVTGSLVWNGGDASWNTSDANWAGGDTFHFLDDVTFDETSPGGGLVTIDGQLRCGTILVNNPESTDYTFHAPEGNRIASGSLVKDGAGSLVIGTDNETGTNLHRYAGGTTIHDGQVRLLQSGNAGLTEGPLGIGPVVMNGGSLSAFHPSLPRQIYNELRLNAGVTLGEAGAPASFRIGSKVTIGATLTIHTPSEISLGKGNDPETGIADDGGGHGFTKTGTGLLELALGTDSSVGGEVVVEEGVFQVGGTLACTGLSVASGATLTGTGSLSSGLGIAAGATLSPGMENSSAKTSAFGVGGNLELDGTFLCGIDAAGADRLVVGGELDISSATLDLTVAAGLELGDARVIASYGSLAGAGFASVAGVPAGYKISYSYDDGSGSNHIALVADLPPYDSWALATGLAGGENAGPGDDANDDGIPNLMHFALATDPLGGGGDEGKRRLELAGDHLTLTLPVRSGAVFAGSPLTAEIDGVVYRILGDDDLAVPRDLAVVEVLPAHDDGLPPLDDFDGVAGADWTYRSFRLVDPLGSHAAAFISVEVVEAP
ncbi:hypothetical protein [Luteolibacter marinus]|uniref:hypothetical protein n=1 Tax=Luteolibacter marinus TaxID=2776705 RepID=UPI00186801F9|nr:hypothetical protein [Luteolibacter marinus]